MGEARQGRVQIPQRHTDPHARRRQAIHQRPRGPPYVSSEPLPLGGWYAPVGAAAGARQGVLARVRGGQHPEGPHRYDPALDNTRASLIEPLVRSRQPGTSTFAHIEFRTQKAAERIMHRHRRRPFAVYLGEQLPVMLDFAAPLIRDSEPSFVLFTPFTRGDEMDVRALFGPHARNIRQVEFRASSEPRSLFTC